MHYSIFNLLVVLLASGFLTWVGIRSVINLFIEVISFWCNVIWSDPQRVNFVWNLDGIGLPLIIVGPAGMLWSILVLAHRCV